METLEHHVEIREHREPDGTLILSVKGALDMSTAPVFAERMADAASRRWALVLDLDGVGFMDADGLTVLLAATTRAREEGCDVSLARPQGPLLRLFHQTGIENVLPLRADDMGGRAPRARGRFARIAGGG